MFGYNRDNFLYDRHRRTHKEFALMNFRIAQAQLWRQDVSDIVSLAERKMAVYLLVNVLFLGFCVMAWCEGRLPSGVPYWMSLGNTLGITGAFIFLLLTVWLAMHAAVC